MIIHFDTEALAIQHLERSGFHLLRNGNWISKSGDVSAAIHPVTGDVVCICFQEVTA